ncbi:biopolymer transporter ExbD [Verrucomicrobiaceae bacterium 227]
MEFYRPKQKPVTVPIVPLIDILVTLLFFFIVKLNDSTDKVQRPEIQVDLPSANSIKVQTVTISRSTLSLGADGSAELDGLKVTDGFLKEFLIGNLKKRPGMKLALRVDKGCPWAKVLEAHGAALDAGYRKEDIFYPVKKPGSTDETQDTQPQ